MEFIGYPATTVIVFCVSITILFSVDLIAHKNNRAISLSEATGWSIFYVLASLLFASFLFVAHGEEKASLFLTGWSLEKVLAFDNLMVFTAIFSYFGIKPEHQHRALHWGIVGAIVFRLIFVAIGATSLALAGPWMEGVFAFIILASVWLMIKANDGEADYRNAWYVRAVKKFYPVTKYHKGTFFSTLHGVRCVTPLFLCLIAIEISDIMFSFDSVPAIIAVTKEPFLIYSSMIFAILGLRSFYFVIAALKRCLRFIDQAVIIILVFIAGKLLAHATMGFSITPNESLSFVLFILTGGIVASLLFKEKENVNV